MRGALLNVFFGARAQVVVGIAAFLISIAFWVLGTFRIPGAASAPWHWSPAAFIFHASMFALLVASWSIVTGGLGYKATERVETAVVGNSSESVSRSR